MTSKPDPTDHRRLFFLSLPSQNRMYRTLLRTSLKRSLHTASSSVSVRTPKARNYALGVVGVSTGVVATYVAWRTWDARALMDAGAFILLDSLDEVVLMRE